MNADDGHLTLHGGDDAANRALAHQFRAVLAEKRLCSSYTVMGWSKDDEGPVTFACECGRFTRQYADIAEANEVLDEHLDEQERAVKVFARQWWADHDSDTALNVSSYLDVPRQNFWLSVDELHPDSGQWTAVMLPNPNIGL